MKYPLVLILLALSSSISAQDVIVKKDGSTILSKVLEVNTADIKYKKFSNQKGPIYTISKSEIMSINYENGEKDTFEDSKSRVSLSDYSNGITSAANDALICDYNDRQVQNILEKKDKKAKWVYRVLKVHPNSLLADANTKLLIGISQDRDKAYFNLSIENNSDNIIYVDLENCTYRINKTANKYFINSSTTKSSGSEGGASVNMGAVTGALGIGGIIGTIASGVNVGGGRNSGSATTIYADRIITIAPHSIYKFTSKSFYDSMLSAPYSKNFKYGDHLYFKQPEKIGDTPFEFVVTFADSENPTEIKRFNLGLYVSEELGISSSWEKDIRIDTQLVPLHYCFKIKGW